MRKVTPIIVTAITTKPVIKMGGGLNLAAILAWARAEELDLPPPKDHPMPIDVPLVCLWRDDAGWPLWAATDIYPIGPQADHRQWLHRRYPADRAMLARSMKVNLAAGPYKERRVLVYGIYCQIWRAAALAEDVAEVDRLLSRVQVLGARTAAGFGCVREWRIERSADIDADFILARRSVPAASGLRTGTCEMLPWTPPYWHHALHAPCIRGAPCF